MQSPPKLAAPFQNAEQSLHFQGFRVMAGWARPPPQSVSARAIFQLAPSGNPQLSPGCLIHDLARGFSSLMLSDMTTTRNGSPSGRRPRPYRQSPLDSDSFGFEQSDNDWPVECLVRAVRYQTMLTRSRPSPLLAGVFVPFTLQPQASLHGNVCFPRPNVPSSATPDVSRASPTA